MEHYQVLEGICTKEYKFYFLGDKITRNYFSACLMVVDECKRKLKCKISTLKRVKLYFFKSQRLDHSSCSIIHQVSVIQLLIDIDTRTK